jgi:NACHT domain
VSSGLLFLFVASCTDSILRSSGIIEAIMAQREAGTASMVYFYCDFRDDDKQNCRNILLSILSQLFSQSNLCCDILARIYKTHDNGTRKPSDETLTKCLTEALSLPAQGRVYLIVDALDECPTNSGMPTPREEVLDLVKDLVGLHLPNLHICVTSRPEIDIQTTLEPLTSLRVSLHNQTGQNKDIADYVNSVVSSDPKMRRWREEDRNLVIETLTERADGM